MATNALVSTLVMGGVLLVILAVVLRLRHWEHPSATVESGGSDLSQAVNGPLGWSVAFFVVTFGVMGLAVLYAAGTPVAGIEPSTLGLLVVAVLGAVMTVAGLVAVYSASRSRGLNSAQAAGISSVVLATIVLVAIVTQLFIGG